MGANPASQEHEGHFAHPHHRQEDHISGQLHQKKPLQQTSQGPPAPAPDVSFPVHQNHDEPGQLIRSLGAATQPFEDLWSSDGDFSNTDYTQEVPFDIIDAVPLRTEHVKGDPHPEQHVSNQPSQNVVQENQQIRLGKRINEQLDEPNQDIHQNQNVPLNNREFPQSNQNIQLNKQQFPQVDHNVPQKKQQFDLKPNRDLSDDGPPPPQQQLTLTTDLAWTESSPPPALAPLALAPTALAPPSLAFPALAPPFLAPPAPDFPALAPPFQAPPAPAPPALAPLLPSQSITLCTVTNHPDCP